ncbi:MAG TPA: hypothetical protein GX726_05355 [Clostridiales bacterium]|jgi:hypothetical protein|nr:hypothetical protein [Clostridiales bacterium]
MRGRRLYLFMVSLIVLLIIALAGCLYFALRPGYMPSLKVVGDVAQPLDLRCIEELNPERQRVHGESCCAVSLAQVAKKAGADQVSRLVLLAADGFSAEISGDTIGQCWLAFDRKRGWHSLSDTLPLSVNAVELEQIIIVSDAAKGLTVENDGRQQHFSIGQLYAGTILSYPYPEGVAEKQGEQGRMTSTVATRRDCLTAAMLGCSGYELRLTDEGGSSRLIPADSGLFQLNGNSLSHVNSQTRTSHEGIRLIQILRP